MKVLLFVPLFFCFAASAQDINGEWFGNYEKQLLIPRPRQLVVELQLSGDSVITGASHLYYKTNKYEHYVVRGVFRQKDSTVYFREDSVLSVRLGLMETKCMGNYTMKLRVTDSSYVLEGKWRDNSKGLLGCPTSGVFLEKKFKRPVATGFTAVQDRVNELQSLIEYKLDERDSIRIDVYDNGEIDGDTVSLYFNDVPLRQHLRITDKPATFYISMDPDIPYNKVYMVAESLGSIPPCTALLIITTRRNRYKVNLSGNMSKNAALEFFLKE